MGNLVAQLFVGGPVLENAKLIRSGTLLFSDTNLCLALSPVTLLISGYTCSEKHFLPKVVKRQGQQ